VDFTMFRIPRGEMGRQSVEVLAAIIEGTAGPTQILLPCAYVEGTTLARPR
jgi:DNA-binding LacI/PurR family transcriptional regulator